MNAAESLLTGRPEAIALIEGDRQVSYAQLRNLVSAAAGEWRRQGVGHGDVCILALNDGIDWVVAFLSLMWIAAVPAPISPRADRRQIEELLEDSGARLLLAEDSIVCSLDDRRAQGRSDWRSALESTVPPSPPPVQVPPEALAFMLFSSGTTGKPKGILHAHRTALHAHAFAVEVLGATPADRFYSTSKLFFAYPLANSLLAGLRLGACVVLAGEWPTPERVALTLASARPTLFFSVPTLYQRLLEANVPMRGIRAAVSAGEACPPALAQAWQSRHGLWLVNAYGTTETLALMLYQLPAMRAFAPTPLTRARAQASADATQSGVRLWFSHPSVSLGYLRPAHHDSARFEGQEFSPGDMFLRHEEGAAPRWSFAGRSDQLLKVFGRWVNTIELEQALFADLRDCVRELSIVSDDIDGMASLHLFAVPQLEQEQAIRQRLHEAIAALPAFKRPQAHLVTDLPRTETGKVRRSVLKTLCRASQ